MSKGFTVAASPLNSVKLELGVILVFALVLWLIVERLVGEPVWQLLVLAGYGLLSMLWLILRTRQVLARQLRDGDKQNGP